MKMNILKGLKTLPKKLASSIGNKLKTLGQALVVKFVPKDPEKKKRLAFLSVLLLIIGIGSSLAWSHYHTIKINSPQYLLDKFNNAIAKGNAFELASTVDMPRLTTQIAKDMLAPYQEAAFEKADISAWPAMPYLKGDTQANTQKIAAAVESLLIDIFALKQPAPAPLKVLLGEDFPKQLAQYPFILGSYTGDIATASTLIHLPFAWNSTVEIGLEKIPNVGWRVTQLLSFDESLAQLISQRVVADTWVKIIEKVRRINNILLMKSLLPELSCSATVTQISGGHSLLTLSLNSLPTSKLNPIRSWGITLFLQDKDGKPLRQPFLEQQGALVAGNPLKDTWSLDLSQEDYETFLAASPLVCMPQIEYLILPSGEALQRQ